MSDVQRFWIDRTATPIGELVLVTDEAGRLRVIEWAEDETNMLRWLRRQHGEHGFALEPKRNPDGITVAMNAYFDGDVRAIDDVRVEPSGTPFQRRVWTALREIPCGTTVSYAELAKRIDHASAVRAVGLANGANPIPIVVPCHRVVGSDGTLTGYGGGIERKRWLLAHEGAARGSVLLLTP